MRRSRKLLFSDATTRLERLNTRICDLGLRIEGTILGRAIRTVKRELRERGIRFRPNFYLSTEYGTVPVTLNIGLAFWDADEHLRRLHKETRRIHYSDPMITTVVRHEVGHAFCYSYKLYRTKEFRELFRVRGHFFDTYPATDNYWYNPWSKDFISPTGEHYAQKHPDEDFAETFTEFMRVKGWKRKHRAKPGAIRKLQYVERIVKQWGRREPLVKGDPNNLDVPIEKVRLTVGEFFRAKPRKYRERATGYIDQDLLAIFQRRGRANGYIGVPRLVRKNYQALLHNVSEWGHVTKPVAGDILSKVMKRSKDMDLVVRPGNSKKAVVELTSFLTAMATRFSMTNKFTNGRT